MKSHPKKRPLRRTAKAKVRLPARKVPDWIVERWAAKVRTFFERQRRALGVPLDALVPVSGLTRQGWRKFERGSKRGPLLTTVLRAAYALRQWNWKIVITPEGPQIQRLR